MSMQIENLIDLLGNEGNRVKEAIADALIDNINTTISEYYLVDVDKVTNQITDLVTECYEEVKERYRQKITKMFEDKIEEAIKNTRF